MTGKKLFEKAGWEVLYRLNDVVVVDPNKNEFTVCEKYWGGDNYDKELKASYQLAVDKGLIKEVA